MIFVLDGVIDDRRVRFSLDPGRCRVGRDPRNDLVLTEGTVSREHAEITVVGDQVEISDLGSRNGTYVDDRPVHDSVEVRIGEVVRFGRVSFTLVEGSPFDWMSPSRQVVLSPSETVSIRRIASPERPGSGEGPSLDDGLDAGTVAAIVQAGRLLVLPNTPVDAVEEICLLTESVVAWRRAVVLVGDTPDGRPAVFAGCGPEVPTGETFLLSEEAWEVLRRDRLPLLLASTQGDRGKREEWAKGPASPLQAFVVPILDRGKVVGGLYLETSEDVAPTPRRVRALTMFADLLSVRVSQARVSRALREQARLEQEVFLAARVQRRMLSNTGFAKGGYEALVRQIPCYEVGGDLYDINHLSDGRVVLALGDVSGKGIGAAMLMSTVMAALRALYDEIHDPAELAWRLHRQLLSFTEPSQYATLFLGFLDLAEGRLDYVNAGHCPPLMLPRGGSPVNLASTGPPLGLLPVASYEAETIRIPDEALLCVLSDGVLEASCAGEFYGEDRIAETLRASTDLHPREIVDTLIRDVRQYTREQPLDDDMTLMVLRRSVEGSLNP